MAHFANLPTCQSDLAHMQATGNLPTLSRVAIRVAWVIAVWSQRRQTRRSLAHLSNQHLDDIGLTRHQALEELDKPFWTP